MLRSGEHCYTNENKPLHARQISFSIGTRKLEPFKCTYDKLREATSSSITFETQKNRQKGEIIAHGISGHAVACPTKALARRIIHVRSIGGSPNTPLCSIARHANGWVVVTSSLLTNLLRSATVLEPDSGVIPEKVQTRSLRAGGAMALLCAQVDSDMIKLVGRWRSDAMFWYLHAQATPARAACTSTGSPLVPILLDHVLVAFLRRHRTYTASTHTELHPHTTTNRLTPAPPNDKKKSNNLLPGPPILPVPPRLCWPCNRVR